MGKKSSIRLGFGAKRPVILYINMYTYKQHTRGIGHVYTFDRNTYIHISVVYRPCETSLKASKVLPLKDMCLCVCLCVRLCLCVCLCLCLCLCLCIEKHSFWSERLFESNRDKQLDISGTNSLRMNVYVYVCVRVFRSIAP